MKTRVGRRSGIVVAAVILLVGLGLIAKGLFIPAKAVLAQVLLDRAWERTLAGEAAAKPWPWADTWPVAKVAVPRLGREAIVLAGASGESMAFGPAHMSTTPLPGRRGLSILAGHRDTHFRFLGDVVAGDRIEVTLADGSVEIFEMTGSAVVRFDRSGLDPFAKGEGLALVTCWPLDAVVRGPLRYVVFARKTERSLAAASAD